MKCVKRRWREKRRGEERIGEEREAERGKGGGGGNGLDEQKVGRELGGGRG